MEEAARKALSDAGLELEWTAEGWEQAHEQAAARSAELKDDSEALKELRFEAFDGHATKKRELAAAQQELVSLKTRKSLLPPSSIENRAAIAAATGVPEEQMPFGGELIDLAEGQEQWRPAAERALRNLATTLLVPGEHFAAVTRYLNDHTVRGALRAVDVSKPLAGGALAVEDVSDGDLLTKLEILTAGHNADAGEWIRERIALDFAYPCVEDPDELAGLDKGLSLGGVVKRNRHTVEKDDRFTSRQDYVLGFDNAAKLELVAGQVEDLQQELAKAAELAQSREESHQGMTRQLEALRRVAEDHRPWEQVSAAVAADELARIEQRLKDALAAQADLEPLRANIEAARQKHQSSTEAAAVLQSEYKALDQQLTAADSLLEAARARLDQAPPSDATVTALEPYFAGFGDVREMHELDNLANRVRTQLLGELHAAESRGQATSERLTRIFEGFVREWGTAISADHGTSIGAAGEFEARYHAIVSDGLPAQEAEFRQFFNQRTHESFSTLLHLLDEERRSITSRILPLNGILSEVNFHEGSFLELDIKQTLPATAKQFKDAIQNALKARHTRHGKSAAAGRGNRRRRRAHQPLQVPGNAGEAAGFAGAGGPALARRGAGRPRAPVHPVQGAPRGGGAGEAEGRQARHEDRSLHARRHRIHVRRRAAAVHRVHHGRGAELPAGHRRTGLHHLRHRDDGRGLRAGLRGVRGRRDQGAARVRLPAAPGRPGKRDRPVPAPRLRHGNPAGQAHQPLRRADRPRDRAEARVRGAVAVRSQPRGHRAPLSPWTQPGSRVVTFPRRK